MQKTKIDPSTPLAVAQNTLLTSAATGSLTGLYGAFTHHAQIGPLVLSAAINGGIAGATFFSFREYVVRNFLTSSLPATSYYRQIRDGHASPQASEQKLTFWDMRAYNVPETVISGAFTGGLLNAWKRGKVGIVPGVTTASILCAALQLAYNEVGIARIKYVSKVLQASPNGQSGVAPSPELPLAQPRKPVSERILTMLGFHKMSDAEYLERLKRKRDGYLRRIAELEGMESESVEDSPQSSSSSPEP